MRRHIIIHWKQSCSRDTQAVQVFSWGVLWRLYILILLLMPPSRCSPACAAAQPAASEVLLACPSLSFGCAAAQPVVSHSVASASASSAVEFSNSPAAADPSQTPTHQSLKQPERQIWVHVRRYLYIRWTSVLCGRGWTRHYTVLPHPWHVTQFQSHINQDEGIWYLQRSAGWDDALQKQS